MPSGRPVFNVLLAHSEPGKKSGITREVYNRSRRRQIPRVREEVRVSTVRARTRFAFLRLRDQDVHLIFGWSLVTCRACAGAWTLVDPVWHCLWEQRTHLFKKSPSSVHYCAASCSTRPHSQLRVDNLQGLLHALPVAAAMFGSVLLLRRPRLSPRHRRDLRALLRDDMAADVLAHFCHALIDLVGERDSALLCGGRIRMRR